MTFSTRVAVHAILRQSHRQFAQHFFVSLDQHIDPV
jgi:hypothetical protein